jgi:Fe-S-cluster containining protein
MNPNLDLLLKNYTALIKRVDTHIKQVEKDYSRQIVCKKGCDSCCRFLNLFPVEAFALSAAFLGMEASRRDPVMAELKKNADNCPLLIKGQCLLYENRPVICRTHGYPLYFEKDGETLVDFCPKNFKDVTSFPRNALFDLEQLNTLLAAINKEFLESIETSPPIDDRIPMSRALLLLEIDD